MQRTSVLLPEPLSPITATVLPAAMHRSMPLSTGVAPKLLHRPRISIIAAYSGSLLGQPTRAAYSGSVLGQRTRAAYSGSVLRQRTQAAYSGSVLRQLAGPHGSGRRSECASRRAAPAPRCR